MAESLSVDLVLDPCSRRDRSGFVWIVNDRIKEGNR